MLKNVKKLINYSYPDVIQILPYSLTVFRANPMNIEYHEAKLWINTVTAIEATGNLSKAKIYPKSTFLPITQKTQPAAKIPFVIFPE